MLKRRILAAVTAAYLGLVGWVTLGPQPYDDRADGWLWRILDLFARDERTDWITFPRVEFAANVVMFFPLGVLLLLLLGRRRWWASVLAGVALSTAIELIQLGLPLRVSDPRDVLANGAGTLLGVLATLSLTGAAPGNRPSADGDRPMGEGDEPLDEAVRVRG